MRYHYRKMLLLILTCSIFGLVYTYWMKNKKRSILAGTANKTDGSIYKESSNDAYDTLVSERSFYTDSSVNYNVHIFYYPWYGNPEFDKGSYYHWNHKYLPHWNPVLAKNDSFAGIFHMPPDDVAASFYPALGAYSSQDPTVLDQHMAWIQESGAGTIVVSWYPKGMSDENGLPWDDLIPKIMDAADRKRLKVAFHLEPYKLRTVESIRKDVEYIFNSYSNHPAFYVYKARGKPSKPVFYLYDSYLITDDDWKRLLRPSATTDWVVNVRHSQFDAYFMGLMVQKSHGTALFNDGFDGLYTYFGADSFSYGSTPENWRQISTYCRRTKMLCSLSVAPGYIDERVRPWNKQNTKHRRNGNYYKSYWQAALDNKPAFVSVTSFNEWHEGTQIEPSIPKHTESFTYLDYESESPDFYLKLTRHFVQKMMNVKV